MARLKNQDREDPVSDVPIRDSPDEERGPRWPFDLFGLRYVTTYTLDEIPLSREQSHCFMLFLIGVLILLNASHWLNVR